jgi:hypothetical protein
MDHNERVDLPLCDKLQDGENGINTYQYCAPAFIASSFFGTFLENDDDLIFTNFDKSSVRSGTLTFLEYRDETFAVTCKHVLEALLRKQEEWRKQYVERDGFEPPIEGFNLFTPINNNQYHFNYKLTAVPPNDDGSQPDVAIARIRKEAVYRLGRVPIELTKKQEFPITGIASGYPEQQRKIAQGERLNTFSPLFTTCLASMQITAKGEIILQDVIEEHNGLDILSGMSGGPVIWSDENDFGFAGIVYEGLDIQPKEGRLMDQNSIWIHGELITPSIFEKWLSAIPPICELKDETKMLHIPRG